MELTPEQTQARDRAVDAFLQGRNFVLSGSAGTGKTTVGVQIVEHLLDAGRRLAVCAPTGKAAHVLNQKQQVFVARTIHSTLTKNAHSSRTALLARLQILENKAITGTLSAEEQAEEQALLTELDKQDGSKGEMTFQPISHDDFVSEYDGLVIDESSMVGEKVRRQFMDHIDVPKLWLGDYAQLPPVQDKPGVDLRFPDVKLEKIHRQREGSGILDVACLFRTSKGQFPTRQFLAQFDDVVGVPSSNAATAIKGFEKTHQFLVWTNKERHLINELVRAAKGLEPIFDKYPYLPRKGETIMVDENAPAQMLMKGQILTVVGIEEYAPDWNPYVVRLSVRDERGNLRTQRFSIADMCTGNQLVDDDQKDEKKRHLSTINGIRCMLSHAITAHKAQGSQWDNVFILCSMKPTMSEYNAWLYTAVTRAAKHLVLADHKLWK